MVIPASSFRIVPDLSRIAAAGPFRRLIVCVRALGIRNGWRYWKLENRAIKDSSLILSWADACDEESRRSATSQPTWSKACGEWAKLLRQHHSSL